MGPPDTLGILNMSTSPIPPPAEVPEDVLSKPPILPSELGRFVNLDGCPQWFQFKYDDDYADERRSEHDYKEAFRPLNLLLAKDGNDFEEEVVDELRAHANVRDHDHIDEWGESRPALLDAFDAALDFPNSAGPLILEQARLGNHLDAWPVAGDADLLVCWPLPPDADENETDRVGLRFRVLDIKAAHEEKTYQQIQVACYTLLLRQFLEHVDVEFPYVIEGGIIIRTDEFDDAAPSSFPSFDLRNREVDVRRFVQEGGPLDDLHDADPGRVRYQLESKCHGCAYKEACYTEALETGSPALLGLSRNDQAVLAENGVDTIEDLARLAYVPRNPRPYEYDDLEPNDRDTYRELLDEPGIAERLQNHIQQAQSFFGRVAPNTPSAAGGNRPVWLVGSGDGTLPADDPGFDLNQPIERGGMIRIYLNVQHDHRYDRINAIGGYVSVSNVEDAISFGQVASGVPDSVAEATDLEEEILTLALNELFDAIQSLGEAMGTDRAPIHFYFFTSNEYETLVEAVTRQDVPGASSVRDLLSLRAAISGRGDEEFDHDEQAMVSIVQRELQERLALGIPTVGLLPALDVCHADEDTLYRSDWSYTRTDGEQVDLREAFDHKLFDYSVGYERSPPGIGLYAEDDRDGYYPSRPRGRAEVPLEYLWAAHEVLTPEWAEEVREESEGFQPVEPFQWVDEETQNTRITIEDIEELVKRFAQGCANLERSVDYRNGDLAKRPLALDELAAFDIGESSTARAATEHLALEHESGRRDQLRSYGLPVAQRIRNGEAVPVVVTDAWVDDDTGVLHVDGQLPYNHLFDDGERVARACRLKETSGTTMGSWVVANRLTRTCEPRDSPQPQSIEHGPPLTVEDLDIEQREIHLTAFPNWGQGNREYRTWHRGWTTDPDEEDNSTYLFAEDEVFIIDEQTDDIVAQRAYDLLAEAQNDTLCQLLEDLATGQLHTPTTEAVSEAGVQGYLDWAVPAGEEVVDVGEVSAEGREAGEGFGDSRSSEEDAGSDSNEVGGTPDGQPNVDPPPNWEQQRFVAETTAQLALLQGPPGTGKTAGALAHATLARVRAFATEGRDCTGIVAGESNKAVDEVLEDVHAALVAYRNQGDTSTDTGCDDLLDELELVRLTSDEPDDPLEHVTYLDYHDDDAELRRVVRRIRRQTGQRTLVFATPARLYKLADNFDVTQGGNRTPEDWLAGDAAFFDLLAVDEASMMRLPSFLSVGAFLREGAQILVAGDHRQMPPVRQHDWENEVRRTVQERRPSLSALDYCRLLRGDDVDMNARVRDDATADRCEVTGTATIPLYSLERSYRCHQRVAEFLREHVYTRDDIPYYSEEAETVRQPRPVSRSVGRVLCDTEALAVADAEPHALTLIVHDEDASRQSNPVEAAIGAAIAQSSHEDDAVGIVTPHNAQRGLLETYLDDVECDTVERYQGGQRPVILVSATASDPDFVKVESEFLLNPNRLNVAMSRMERGLVVVASERVFDVIPPEVKEYERAGLWKGLFDDLGVLDGTPAWEGSLEEFVGDADLGSIDPPLETRLEVHTLH